MVLHVIASDGQTYEGPLSLVRDGVRSRISGGPAPAGQPLLGLLSLRVETARDALRGRSRDYRRGEK